MKIIDVIQGSEEWHKARAGKVSGTVLKTITGNENPLKKDVVAECKKQDLVFKPSWTIPTLMDLLPPKSVKALKAKIPKPLGFYEVLAGKIAYDKGDEKPMDRGTRLEPEARKELEIYLDEKIEEVGMCVHDDVPDIAISPDGIIRKKGHVYYAVEIKCLSTARHLQALIENRIPEDYKYQILQYFIVMEELEVLHFAFYDPRIVGHELVVFEVTRDEVQEEVEKWFQYQKEQLEEINILAAKYSNF